MVVWHPSSSRPECHGGVEYDVDRLVFLAHLLGSSAPLFTENNSDLGTMPNKCYVLESFTGRFICILLMLSEDVLSHIPTIIN